eukprot:scaffold179_cov368-Prasinococcus_capsulatus_cf.AAC.1
MSTAGPPPRPVAGLSRRAGAAATTTTVRSDTPACRASFRTHASLPLTDTCGKRVPGLRSSTGGRLPSPSVVLGLCMPRLYLSVCRSSWHGQYPSASHYRAGCAGFRLECREKDPPA